MTDQTKAITLQDLGDRDHIREYAERLKLLMPNGQKLTDVEANATAQLAWALRLNPFTGDVYPLKSRREVDGKWIDVFAGVTVGIAGRRKLARRHINEIHPGKTFTTSCFVDSADKAIGKTDPKFGEAVCWRCELRDEATTDNWIARLKELTAAGVPYNEVKDIIGPAPVFVGYGVAYTSEKSKMNLHDRARKRAEAAALKLAYDIEFPNDNGGDIDTTEEYDMDAEPATVTEVPPEPSLASATEEELIGQLGFPTN